MNDAKYDRSITLLCPTCGNSNMELENEDTDAETIKCPSCNRIMTREELVRENGELIENSIEEVKEEVFRDVQKTLRDTLKKSFAGSKNIRIR